MSQRELTYTTVRNELLREVFRYTFTGPLLLVWSTGLVTFLMMFDRPLFALLWSGAIVIVGVMMAGDYLRTAKVRERLIRSVVQKRFSAQELTDGWLQAALDKGIDAFTEITLKIYQSERQEYPNAPLRRMIPLTYSMASLLRECIMEAQELERGLKLARSSTPEDEVLQIGKAGALPSRRQASIEETRRAADQARLFVNDIIQQLESIMLAIFQAVPGNSTRSAELVREAEATLTTLTRRLEWRHSDGFVAAEVRQIQECLEAGFTEIDSAAGLGALQRLVYEHAQLHPLLEPNQTTESIRLLPLSGLVGEIYRMGLGLLYDALEVMRSVHPSETRRLEAEVRDLEEKIAPSTTDHSEAERVKLLQATLSCHLERLAITHKQHARIDDLLHLSRRCEASLHRTRMELASLNAADAELDVNAATESLRRTIEQAQEVQEELKKIGL